MADPAPQRSLKRISLWILLLIVAIWIVYALTGGPSTPSSETAPNNAGDTQQR